jgi:cytosine/adenosine deaminase-related metal-dependent hydrolase
MTAEGEDSDRDRDRQQLRFFDCQMDFPAVSRTLPKTEIRVILSANGSPSRANGTIQPTPPCAATSREDSMARTLFTNVTVIDGSGVEPFAGEVLVDGNRIKSVARGRGTIASDGAERVDGAGTTLMPGLVEAHAHISFANTPDLASLGDIPPEEHTLLAALVHHRLLGARIGHELVARGVDLQRVDALAALARVLADGVPGEAVIAAGQDAHATPLQLFHDADGVIDLDIRILQDAQRFLAIMKDGTFHKAPTPRARSAEIAAE